MTPPDLKEIAGIIGGVFNEIQTGFARVDAQFGGVYARLDGSAARLRGTLGRYNSRNANLLSLAHEISFVAE